MDIENKSLYPLFTKINYLKGVGPRLYNYYKQLLAPKKDEVYFKDLLFHLPHSLIVRKKNPENLESNIGREILIEAEIVSLEKVYFGRRKGFKAKILYHKDQINLIFYNSNEQYLRSVLEKGATKLICGKLEIYKNHFQITHPHISAVSSGSMLEREPIYSLTTGITNKQITKLIGNNLDKIPEIKDWIDQKYLEDNHFQSFKNALQKIHKPEDQEDLSLDSRERKRLAFDELLADQLALGLTRDKIVKMPGKKINSKMEVAKKIINSLEFNLTEDQRNAIKDLTKDLKSENRMFRLIQGDVGSGKTIVGMVAILNAIEAGFQACFMAPTEILAKQQFSWLKESLKSAEIENIEISLLVGSQKESEKKNIHKRCAAGKIDILIGTHALFQEKALYKNLGIIVIDEQHKFGVSQRFQLASKGDGVNILFMTATPIPRTLSMTLYGDMDISIIKEKPSGRKPIKTTTISSSKIQNFIQILDKEINLGQKIYWVCPFVEQSEDNPFQDDEHKIISATERYEALKKYFGKKVGLVHGQLPAEKKDAALDKFKSGDVAILVATTVIEVGVDVPDATIIVIENAERFGLSQLHQLRGRVGRGRKESNCVLIYSKNISDNGIKRLKVMKDTEDGFVIAEEDMILRGAGEVLGVKQSGLPDYKIAVLPEHKELLFAARDDVKIILQKDPELTSVRGKNLRNLLQLFEYDKQVKNLNA